MTRRFFDEALYKKSSVSDLIIFCLSSLGEREKCTFENLVKECFNLFPKVFAFSHLPKWPDSRKLDRPLRTLRKKKLIVGNPKTSFSLTRAGKRRAEEIARSFRQGKLLQL